MTQRRMERAALEGIELEYERRGTGEPVVLIHPGHFADWFTPLLADFSSVEVTDFSFRTLYRPGTPNRALALLGSSGGRRRSD